MQADAKSVIKISQQTKALDELVGFTDVFYQIFKEYLFFTNYSKKLKSRRQHYKASITLIPKSDKDTRKKKIAGQYP